MEFLPQFKTAALVLSGLMSFAGCYRPIAACDQAKLLAKAAGNLANEAG
jgi:hypothetical protein